MKFINCNVWSRQQRAINDEKVYEIEYDVYLVNKLKFIHLLYPELKEEEKKKNEKSRKCSRTVENNQIYNLMWMGLKIVPHGRHNKTKL